MPRLTPHQQDVLARLRAGEHLCWNYRYGGYQFGDGGDIANQTFRSLQEAELICPLGDFWVATEKGDGDGDV